MNEETVVVLEDGETTVIDKIQSVHEGQSVEIRTT